jgi:hypothetical protein
MTAEPKRLPAGVERRRTAHRDPVGIARTTPDTRSGRSMTGAKGAVLVDEHRSELTQEQRQWNEKIAAKKKSA